MGVDLVFPFPSLTITVCLVFVFFFVVLKTNYLGVLSLEQRRKGLVVEGVPFFPVQAALGFVRLVNWYN